MIEETDETLLSAMTTRELETLIEEARNEITRRINMKNIETFLFRKKMINVDKNIEKAWRAMRASTKASGVTDNEFETIWRQVTEGEYEKEFDILFAKYCYIREHQRTPNYIFLEEFKKNRRTNPPKVV